MKFNDLPEPAPLPRVTQWVALFLLAFGGWNIVMAMNIMVADGALREGIGVAVLGIILTLLGLFLDRGRIRAGQLKVDRTRDDQLM